MPKAAGYRPILKTRFAAIHTINCLYYQIGLGPRWSSLVEMWQRAHNDPAKLKTFVNSRLAEAGEGQAMCKIKLNIIADRAEAYPLSVAPLGICGITAGGGGDTQDDRLEVQIVGWSKGLAGWVLDYVVLPGYPEDDKAWCDLVDLINK